MPRITDILRKSCLRDVPDRVPDLNELHREQWSSTFEHLRRNRMVQGAFRYGLLKRDNSGASFDSIGSIVARCNKYRKDRNPEHLLDIANLAMVEFARADLAKMPEHTDTDDVHAEWL